MTRDVLKLFIFSTYLISVVPNYINNIYIYKDEICINAESGKIAILMVFLKNHKNCNFKQLTDICAVDYPNKKKRFVINYNLLSISFNFRIRVKIFVEEFSGTPSVSDVFFSALWLEREVWDMYGIFFSNHKDLRRILTDYGFEGYPFRKDFPQIGFIEVRYDEKKKQVVYEPLELAQNYRTFSFSSPWIQVK